MFKKESIIGALEINKMQVLTLKMVGQRNERECMAEVLGLHIQVLILILTAARFILQAHENVATQ